MKLVLVTRVAVLLVVVVVLVLQITAMVTDRIELQSQAVRVGWLLPVTIGFLAFAYRREQRSRR